MEKFLVKKAPQTLYYIPNFISQEDEIQLIKEVYDSPKPKWTQLKNRRLQNWGGLPMPKGMITESIPDWLNVCCENIFKLDVFGDKKPNHILINEYLPGQGIMPHVDGLLYYPTVTTISLGSHTLLDFYKPLKENNSEDQTTLEDRYAFSVYLEPRSLVVLKDEMYTTYLHGIKEVEKDLIYPYFTINYEQIDKSNILDLVAKRDTRISLTIRHVPKVIKANLNSLIFNINKRN